MWLIYNVLLPFAHISFVAFLNKYAACNHSKVILSIPNNSLNFYQTKLINSISHWPWFPLSCRNYQPTDIVSTTKIQEEMEIRKRQRQWIERKWRGWRHTNTCLIVQTLMRRKVWAFFQYINSYFRKDKGLGRPFTHVLFTKALYFLHEIFEQRYLKLWVLVFVWNKLSWLMLT